MARRRPDRAQSLRSRRVWWERNGAFVRGMIAGVVITLLAVWTVRALSGHIL
jgi:hypothetical protein